MLSPLRRRITNSCRVLTLSIVVCATVDAAAQGNLDKRLIQKTAISGESQPLEKLLETLCTKHKLKLQINNTSLAAEGLDASTSVSGIRAEGITLASALNLILEPLQLMYRVDRGTLYVDTSVKINEQLVTATYPVGGLGPFDPDMLHFALQQMSSGEWEEIDGVGGKVVAMTPQSISISQSPATHAEIADLLERTAAALSGKRRAATLIDRSEDMLRRTLARPISLPAGEVEIEELDELLWTELKINVVISEADLADEGIDSASKLTLSGEKQPAGVTVAAALASQGLVPLIRHEVLYITTKARAEDFRVVQIYDARARNRTPEDIAAQVVQIKELGPWEDVDGIGGTVAVLGPLVLIRQTAAAHEQLAQQLGPGK